LLLEEVEVVVMVAGVVPVDCFRDTQALRQQLLIL
jgi:hypothetical protein